jgi:hypothetical protein
MTRLMLPEIPRPFRAMPALDVFGRLEGELCDYLHDSRVHRGCRERAVWRRRRSYRGLNESQRRAASQVSNGIGKVHMIQDIVGVRPDQQPEPLVQAKVLSQAEVGVEIAWSAERISRNRSEGGLRPRREEIAGTKAGRVYGSGATLLGNGRGRLRQDRI